MRRKSLILVVVLFGMSSTSAGIASFAPTYEGGNGRVIVAGMPLVSMRPDGTGRRVLAKGGSYPAVSPDGRWLAYVAEGPSIYKMRLDRGVRRRLTSDEYSDYSPSWSPDGRRIVFTRVTGEADKAAICVIRPDGSHLSCVTSGDKMDDYAQWVDNKRIIFVRNRRETGYELRIARVGRSGSRVVSDPGEYYAYDYSLARDGKWLVYVHERISQSGNQSWGGLARIRIDGTQRKQLVTWSTEKGTVYNTPFISPDGRKIAYFGGRRSRYLDLHVMNRDGTHKRLLMRRTNMMMAWSPNSRALVVVARRHDSNNLYRLRLRTGSARLIERGVGLSWLQWQRRG